MAETLNLGTNGNWATKKDSLLAYNSENNNFKPLPFNFTRNSSATRVNKEGLIEVVSNNEPRIDFKDSSEGSLLLEPSRTNYSASSELPSTWTYTEFGSGSAGTITTGKTDMFGGTNAVQIDFPSDAENVGIRFGSALSSLSSGNASVSIYVKLVESGSKNIQLRCNFKDIVNVNSTEFKRVDLTGTKTTNEAFNLKLRPSEGTSSGGFSIIVCHPQEENGSYATSYIPTSGGVVTRSADVCTNGGNEQVFNSIEGVLYWECSALSDDVGTTRVFSISDGSSTNSLYTGYNSISNLVQSQLLVNGVAQTNMTHFVSDRTEFIKVAVLYKNNNHKMYVNGVEVRVDTSGSVPSANTFDRLNFDLGQGSFDFYGNVKDVRVYNTALTDQELINLTKI